VDSKDRTLPSPLDPCQVPSANLWQVPPSALAELAAQVHARGRGLVLALTGGGSQAISQLLSLPGASRSVLEAIVPYAPRALGEWLGTAPAQACDERTARSMAMVAWRRAQRLCEDSVQETLGVGCTASLASDRSKRGTHRAHVGLQSAGETLVASLELTKGLRTRGQEEGLVAWLVLALLAEDGATPLGLTAAEEIRSHRATAEPGWGELLAGTRQAVLSGTELSGGIAGPISPTAGLVVFPGSFNPRHRGHERMAQLASEFLGKPVAWEISVENVDKPTLDYLDLAGRCRQFNSREPLWLTRAATFVEKARLFPAATFIIGGDTLARLAEPHYYPGETGGRDQALAELAALGTRFLVFARAASERLNSLATLPLPPPLANLCQAVSDQDFLDPISSTSLRELGAG